MPETAASAEKPVQPDSVTGDYDASADYVEEAGDQEKARIADPLEPFNRAMYHFNDKLYFWVLKPVAQGYRQVVPEVARIGVNNFFSNIAFPIRFVNCLLQANFNGAARELGRFVLNTLWGIGGLLDPASHPGRQSRETGRGLRADAGGLRGGAGVLHQLADPGAFQPPGYARDWSAITSSIRSSTTTVPGSSRGS